MHLLAEVLLEDKAQDIVAEVIGDHLDVEGLVFLKHAKCLIINHSQSNAGMFSFLMCGSYKVTKLQIDRLFVKFSF